MRRMLLLACAVGLCGTVGVVAFAASSPLAERPSGSKADAPPPREPDGGPFALAAARAETEAAAERHRAAQAAYAATHEPDPPRASRAIRVQLIARVADRLGVDRRSMWRAVTDVRRQISGREWSDARDEALRMLARELDRPFADVKRAVRVELRHRFSAHEGGR